jgi:hypothetical protein
MIVTLHTSGLQTLAQVRAFVEGNAPIAFTLTDRTATRQWMADTLRRLHYAHGTRSDKGLLRRYLAKVTGLSRAQVSRAIAQFSMEGDITDRRRVPAKPFARRYTDADIRLLAELVRCMAPCQDQPRGSSALPCSDSRPINLEPWSANRSVLDHWVCLSIWNSSSFRASSLLEFMNVIVVMDFLLGLAPEDMPVQLIMLFHQLRKVAVGALEFLNPLLELRQFMGQVMDFAKHGSSPSFMVGGITPVNGFMEDILNYRGLGADAKGMGCGSLIKLWYSL